MLGLLVGLALGLSGTLIQAVGRNPLADTEILGINSGAALFVVSAIALLGMTGIWTYIWFAFAGALFAMAAGLSGRDDRPCHRHAGPRAARGRRGRRGDGRHRLRRPAAQPAGIRQHAVLGRRRARRPASRRRRRDRSVHRRRRGAVPRRQPLAQRHRARRRTGKEHGRQRRSHPGAEPGRRHPAGRRGHRRRRPDRLRRPDGAARGAQVHRPGLALDPRLRHRRGAGSAAGRRHRRDGSSSGPQSCPPASSPRSSARRC